MGQQRGGLPLRVHTPDGPNDLGGQVVYVDTAVGCDGVWCVGASVSGLVVFIV